MSRMKHLLRKLHIHHHHHQQETVPAFQEPEVEPVAAASAVTPSSSTAAVSNHVSNDVSNSSGNDGGSSGGGGGGGMDFNYFEEEFQVQLALAMSVSDPDSRDDPETAQIKAAKQISLGIGCAPSQSLVELLSLRYWSYNVVNYDEKLMDGFYDVYGINSNSFSQGKMPLLVDLEAISVSDNVDYEVILINRLADTELRRLEETVYYMYLECRALRNGPFVSVLVQKIAELVVDRMGGPVSNAEEILKRWTKRSYELRSSLNTIVLPLGCLDVGLSRHRALLFKVLCDRITLPCMLVKGSYYTGTDEGAVNFIKFDNGSEYIIDLMGAPGTLIPAEIPSSQLQDCGLDVRNVTPIPPTIDSSCSALEKESGTVSAAAVADGTARISRSNSEPPFVGIRSKGNGNNASENLQTEQFENDFGSLLPSLGRTFEGSPEVCKKTSSAQEMQVEDVSKYVITAAKNPDFAQKLHAVLLEGRDLSLADMLSNMNLHNSGEQKLCEKKHPLNGEGLVGVQCFPETYLVNKEQSFILGQLSSTSTYHGTNKNCISGLPPQQQELRSAAQYTACGSTFDNSTEGFVLVKGGKCHEETHHVSESVFDVVEMAGVRESSAWGARNDQIDPVLGEVAEWEIPWEDLQIGERIGIGSYGEVYRSDWNGTEVAVKKFMNQDISGDALEQFKCEVEIMLRLRHPNVVLFMGAVTRPPNLSILTEFLPRGSLFKLLHRSSIQLEEKRRMRMALDVAKGMNYLHTSHPVIVHRDLKTPNLLVDKNWVVKVCDFGMSRMQHHTYLSSKSAAGTAEWMAPEVLRNEPSNEKSDVYSFGVILWELATLQVPWTGMNSMQVVGAVGFQGRHLKIPAEVDPAVAEIITDCWNTNPQARPSFGQIITRLKCLQHLVVHERSHAKDH